MVRGAILPGMPMTSRHGRGWRLVAAGLLIAAANVVHPVLAAEDDSAAACQRAGLDTERKLNLPPGLLLAIGLVESGRLNPTTGRRAPWPWTINVNGVGRMFESLTEALVATRPLQARGPVSLDVGCFQINLFHHPTAFASLEEAFDPQANAAYAGRFLVALRTRTGTWEKAIAAYHSATPERGDAYRDRVLTGLTHPDMRNRAVVPRVERVLVWTPDTTTKQMRIWTPSPLGMAPTIISIRLPYNRSQTTVHTITISR